MYKKIISICSLATLFLGSTTTLAASIEAPSSNQTNWSDRWQNADWMSRLKDDTLLSNLSIPGTHDTAADDVSELAKTQSLSIPKQLENGIRFLDVRVRAINGVFAVHHGEYYLNMMFGDVLNETIAFLSKHPDETVYMRLKQEKSSESNAVFNKIFQEKYVKNYSSWFYYSSESGDNPPISATRGKIVIMRNFKEDTSGVGIPYISDSTDIQDNYEASTYWEKTQSVNAQLNNSNSHYNDGKTYINYVSYWDWDDTNWGRAQHMNNETMLEMRRKVIKHAGIVVADYPGDQLINRTIDMNQKNLKNPATYYDNSLVIIRAGQDPDHRVLDSNLTGFQALIYNDNGGLNQKWVLKYIPEKDAYTIEALFSSMGGKSLVATVSDKVAVNDAFSTIIPEYKPIADGEYWKIQQSPYYGFYGNECKLVNVGNGKNLDIYNNSLKPYGYLITYPNNDQGNQNFQINQD